MQGNRLRSACAMRSTLRSTGAAEAASSVLQELQARLQFVQRQRQQTVAQTRADILRSKLESQARLQQKAADLARIRRLANAQALARRENAARSRRNCALRSSAEREHKTIAVATRLTEKRSAAAAERSRLAADRKRVGFLLRQQAAGAEQVRACGRGLEPLGIMAMAWRRGTLRAALPECVARDRGSKSTRARQGTSADT